MTALKLSEVLKAAQADVDRQRYAEAADLMARHAALPAAHASNGFHRLHGEALRRCGHYGEAVAALMQALALKPDDVYAYLQLAFSFEALEMPLEAAECFRTAALLQPESVMAQAYQAHGDQRCVRWQDYGANVASLAQAIEGIDAKADHEFGAPFALVGLPHHPMQMLKAAHLGTNFLARGIQPMSARPVAPRQRLRIGYLSGDFHAHATSALLVSTLEARDRERFEILLFSHGPDDGSPMRQRVMNACDQFIDVTALSLEETAIRIRATGVDILVDLKGHTAGSRFATLAYRPAPVQAAWLGFPGTSGANFIDYIVGDATVTPLEQEPFYSERIAQLPGCYQPNGMPERMAATPRAELSLAEDAFVLLSANQVFKITPPLFDAWMEILRRVPKAILWQLTGGEVADANLRAEVQARGVDPQRLVFMPKLADMRAHARRLGAADLALDTWPCNGHTTTSDALAAGVPVLTLEGENFAGRVAASILKTAGLAELVCDNAAGYIELACALESDRPRLIELRARASRHPAELFEPNRFARKLEGLYERMWERAAAGLPPAALPAEDQS